MKSGKRLDSVSFQLTPTRTRFDLVITAKGKTEKIGSGLLNPFLAHLKTAQDQIDKGGYSIVLEPTRDSDMTWFTKGTVERFVRFVSTPEIIERVYSLETEILQLEKAIAAQGNNDMGLTTVEEKQGKHVVNREGIKSANDSSNERAIVLYNPEAHPSEANGSTPEHGDSKVQYLKVQETRKTVLQKEQGMAFARAVAAGFDIDHMSPLLSFAECFGASRLLEACSRFIELWKQKHETGQWVEVEAAQAMSIPPDYSDMANQQIQAHGDLNSETNGKPVPDSSIDENRFPNPQAQAGQQGYYQGQFPYPMFPSWPAHSPPGTMPVYQPYPVQGMPYYQPYPGSGPFYPPPHQPMDDFGHSDSHRGRRRRHSLDSRERSSASEESLSESEASQTRSSRKKGGKKDKKKHGTVVIRNINYVASKDRNSSDSESASETDNDTVNQISSSLKRKESNGKSIKDLSLNIEQPINGKESGHWEAFQSFLLRDSDEKSRGDDQSMFGLEKNSRNKRPYNTGGDDPIAFSGRGLSESQNGRISELDKISGNTTRMLRGSNDERLMSREERNKMDNQTDVQFGELNERKLAYRNNGNDDFMAVAREGQLNVTNSVDPLSINVSHLRDSVEKLTDESYIVPFRQVRTSERTAIYMDPELTQKPEDGSENTGNQVNYEPDYLHLMPERGTEKGAVGFDPALEYEMQVNTGDKIQNKEAMADAKQTKKKMTPDSYDKKKNVGPIRRGKLSKLSPLDDARARAEKLRSYKADLQKLKKEKEEEQQKRLDALKRERQKRIAARGGATSAPSPSSQEKFKKQLPTKTSPSSHRGSKFSDTDPGSSPLQRSKLRTLSLGTPQSQNASTTTKSTNDIQLPGNNRLTRSVSSLPRKVKMEITPDPKASMARIRRLSEPKASGSSSVSLAKTRTPPVIKPKVQELPESIKIAAIINLDRSKAATLPELKIKTSKEPLEVKKYQKDDDDNPIIDKTVVIFEHEKPSITVTGVQREQLEPVPNQLNEQSRSYKVNTSYTEGEPPRTSSVQITEVPCEPLETSATATTVSQNKALVSGFANLKIEKNSESPEKTQVKDSPKGFKRLLKFGKKSHNSTAGEQSLESDKSSVNGSDLNGNAINAASSSEAHSLKNLISQEISPAGETTTQKSARHFSLLSPFRSKNSEKKSTT